MFGHTLTWVDLGRGLLDETGVWHRSAALQPLSGEQEVLMGMALDAGHPVQTVNQLLTACVTRIGGFHPVDAGHAAALSLGDRQRLLLELRALMHGDGVRLSLRCPNPACGELAGLDLSIRCILNDITGPEPEWFRVETPDGTALVRPPTGIDQETCASCADDRDPCQALLWCRLIASIGEHQPLNAGQWRSLQPDTRHGIALFLAENQSAPDLSFVSPCPSCGAWMEFDLDPLALLVRELRIGADRLMAETHCLAFHYGWSEDQILALPRHRRWRYLELLRNQIEGRPLLNTWR